MDLGISGKWALVCGASKGLGLGCAKALVQEGVNVLLVARGAEALQAAVAQLTQAYASKTGARQRVRLTGTGILTPAEKSEISTTTSVNTSISADSLSGLK